MPSLARSGNSVASALIPAPINGVFYLTTLDLLRSLIYTYGHDLSGIIMKGFLLGVTKLILGVSFALVLLSLTGVATARYFMAKLSVLPPRPVFDNDVALQSTETPPPPAPAEASPPTPEAEAEAAPPPPEKPPGSYEAVVIQPIGLVLRSGPGAEHQQLGGVDYNDQVLVLETDPGERWVKVRISSSGQEGWVKAGNTQALNEAPQ